MSEAVLNGTDECLALLNRLEKQLNDNMVSFGLAFSGEICDNYKNQTKRALEECRELKKQLNQLRAEERQRMLEALQ